MATLTQRQLPFTEDRPLTWSNCSHSQTMSTLAVVPVGCWCLSCRTLLYQCLPIPPEVLGYESADWAWHYKRGREWKTREVEPQLSPNSSR